MSSGNGDCFDASCDPSSPSSNVDVDGIAVSVASVVLTLCLRILITWSPEDVGVGIQASFLQIYPILLSTLFSINRQQLSTDDVDFALNLTSSPLMAYLVLASICDLCGAKTGLYKRIKSHRRITRSLGAFIVPLWFTLTGVVCLSTSAFTNDDNESEDYSGTGVSGWFLYLASFIINALQPGPYPPLATAAIGVFSVLLLFRNWSQLVAEVRLCLSKPWGWFRLPHAFIKGAWCIIDRNHKWFIYTVFASADSGWALSVIASSNGNSSDKYVLSYGQVLSAFAAVPPFISAADFVYSSRFDLLRTVRSFPTRCRAEVVFLLTGKKPDHLVHNILPLTSPAPTPRVPQEGPHGSPPEESPQSANPTSPPKILVDGSQDDVTSPNTSHTQVSFFPYDIIAS